MALNVGNLPVKQVYVGSTPVKAVYVGSQKVWPTVVQITGTSGMTSRNQLKDAVTALGLDYRTVTHLPFEIDTSQATSLLDLFNGWAALVVAPEMTTLQVTDMGGLFRGCTALEYVGDLQTSNVTNAGFMFNACPALTDGNVRLLGKHPNVSTTAMIDGSGLTREPWYTAGGTIQRTVSIQTHYSSPNNVWTSGTQSGDTDLITYFSNRYIRLSADVTCNRPVTAAAQTVAPGTVIAAGSNIYPNDWGVTFTFTTT